MRMKHFCLRHPLNSFNEHYVCISYILCRFESTCLLSRSSKPRVFSTNHSLLNYFVRSIYTATCIGHVGVFQGHSNGIFGDALDSVPVIILLYPLFWQTPTPFFNSSKCMIMWQIGEYSCSYELIAVYVFV